MWIRMRKERKEKRRESFYLTNLSRQYHFAQAEVGWPILRQLLYIREFA